MPSNRCPKCQGANNAASTTCRWCNHQLTVSESSQAVSPVDPPATPSESARRSESKKPVLRDPEAAGGPSPILRWVGTWLVIFLCGAGYGWFVRSSSRAAGAELVAGVVGDGLFISGIYEAITDRNIVGGAKLHQTDGQRGMRVGYCLCAWVAALVVPWSIGALRYPGQG